MKNILAVTIITTCTIVIISCGSKDVPSPPPPPPPPPPSAPSITRFSPTADTLGTIVTIYGANFDANKNNDEVKFNGAVATVQSASTDSLTAKVPANASSGKITVTVSGRSVESATEFTILYLPAITSISPLGDTVGAHFTIKGKNFGNTIDKNIVNFEGDPGPVPAQVLQASDTQLVVKIPAGAISGRRIHLIVNNHEAKPEFVYYILSPPVISSFTPFAGPTGSVIQINGSGFTQYPGGPITIRFNGLEATDIHGFSNSAIGITVPNGATTGKVSVTIGSVTGISTTDFIVSSQLWKRKKDLNVGREGAIGFSIGNKGYVGMGRTFGSDTTRRDLWEYDPATDEWTRKADIPAIGKWLAFSFVINGKAYIVGGSNGPQVGNNFETWEYDPANDKWTRKADYAGWSQIQPIAFSIGNKGYFGLGNTYDVWEFDPAANTWTEKNHFPGDWRQGASSFVIGNKAYMVGGGWNYDNKKDLWEYNPATDSWTQKADCPAPARNSGKGFSIGDYGYLGFGEAAVQGPYLKDLWEYNPATNTWTQKVDFPVDGRILPVEFTINGKAYIAAGSTLYKFYGDMFEFTP